MTSYTFNDVSGTNVSGSSLFYDVQYLNQYIYLASNITVSNSSTIFKIHIFHNPVPSYNASPLYVGANNIICLAPYDDNIIYWGTDFRISKINGNIIQDISYATIAAGVGKIRSMTFNSDKSLLYVVTQDGLHSVTITPTKGVVTKIDATITNISCVRFNNNQLYISSILNKIYKYNIVDSSLNTIYTDLSFSFGGIAFDSYNNLHVSTYNSTGTVPPLHQLINGSLVPITTNISNTVVANYMAFDSSNFLYTTTKINNTSSSIIKKSNPAFCFNEGTKILCLNEELFDEYISVENLQEGDFVKTFKHGYRKIIQVIKGSFRNNPNQWNMCMYKMTKTETNGLLEDLIVTGGHSLLVDSISDVEQAEYDEMGLTDFSKITIDGKHLLLACVSEQFVPMQDNDVYTYYHLLLENNNDEEERFGIWANGILTETPNEKTLK